MITKSIAKFLSALSLLPMVLYFQVAPAQVSKPKEPKRPAKKEVKVDEVQKREIAAVVDLKKVVSQLQDRSTVGQFYDLLSQGIAAPHREALLKKLAADNGDWRKGQLPAIEVTERGFKISNRGTSFAAEYVLKDDIFAKLNGREITFEQAADPERLIRRVEAIAGNTETPRKVSFFRDLLLPRAKAGFFLGINFTGIIQMIFMFKMMDMMMNSFRRPLYPLPPPYSPRRPPHPHYYYQYQQRYNGSY